MKRFSQVRILFSPTLNGEKEMSNKKKVEELYKLIEQRRLHLVDAEADIKNYRNLIKELEAEKTPAEMWVNDKAPEDLYDDAKAILIRGWSIEAHEAGQQYVANQEKKKYKKLLQTAASFCILFENIKNTRPDSYFASKDHYLHFKEELKNLNHKPEEKLEIIGFFLRSAFHKNDSHKEITFLVDHDANLTNKKYLLTPIKEK